MINPENGYPPMVKTPYVVFIAIYAFPRDSMVTKFITPLALQAGVCRVADAVFRELFVLHHISPLSPMSVTA